MSSVPGDYLQPAPTTARHARQLGVIRDRLRRRPESRRVVFVAAALMVTLVLIVALWPRAPQVIEGASAPAVAQVESVSGEHVLTLQDGSRITVSPRAVLRFPVLSADAVAVELDGGRARFDVTKRPVRSFVVRSAGYEVRVVGTIFSVALTEGILEVSVEQGTVEVARGGTVEQRLDAGESWSKRLSGPAPPASIHGAAPAATPAPATSTSDAPIPRPAAPESAKHIFERAQRARAQGRSAEAAAAFRELLRKYPNDSRASLAAFELARLQLDDKDDPAAAAKTLDHVLDSTPKSAPHRQDVEARRIEALAAAGEAAKCRKARDAYLQRYPQGVHRARVIKACP